MLQVRETFLVPVTKNFRCVYMPGFVFRALKHATRCSALARVRFLHTQLTQEMSCLLQAAHISMHTGTAQRISKFQEKQRRGHVFPNRRRT